LTEQTARNSQPTAQLPAVLPADPMGFALGAQGPFHSSIEPSTTFKRLISTPQHFTSAAFDQTQHLTNTTFAKLAPLARYSTSMTSPDERIIMA